MSALGLNFEALEFCLLESPVERDIARDLCGEDDLKALDNGLDNIVCEKTKNK